MVEVFDDSFGFERQRKRYFIILSLQFQLKCNKACLVTLYALCPFKILKRPSENFSDGLLYKGKYSLALILLVAKDKTDRKNA